MFCNELPRLWGGGGGCTPYNGLNGKAPPKGGTVIRLEMYKRVGITRVAK